MRLKSPAWPRASGAASKRVPAGFCVRASARSAPASTPAMKTAVLVAAIRLADARRPDGAPPVLPEPLLPALLAGAEGVEGAVQRFLDGVALQEREQGVPRVSPTVAGRARYGDEVLMGELQRLPHREVQVVILGAGLDTRAWRLPFTRPETFQPPGDPSKPSASPSGTAGEAERHVTVYDVEEADLVAFKQQRAQDCGAQLSSGKDSGASHAFPLTASRYVPVAADLRQDDWTQHLLAAGFQTGQLTVWVMEGLFYYLERAAGSALLQAIARLSTPDSSLIFSSLNAAFGRAQQAALNDPDFELTEEMRGLYASCVSWLPEDEAGFLRELGWDIVTSKTERDLGKAYGYKPFRSTTTQRMWDRFVASCGQPEYHLIFARRRADLLF